MPIITKAATPLRMPRYLTPKTTWYKKRAIRQLSPMLARPKKVRNTAERQENHKETVNIHTHVQIMRYIHAKWKKEQVILYQKRR